MHNLSFAVIDFASPKFTSCLEGKSYPLQIPSHTSISGSQWSIWATCIFLLVPFSPVASDPERDGTLSLSQASWSAWFGARRLGLNHLQYASFRVHGSNNGRPGNLRQLIGLLLLQSAKSFYFLFCCFADLIRLLCDFCIVNLSVYKLPHYVNAECFKTQIYAQRAWIFEVF